MNGRSEQMSQEVRDHVLNRQLLKKEREKLEKAVKNHENIQNLVRQDMAALFDQRKRAAREVVEVVETYVNGLSNSPKEFDRTVQEYRIETCRFNQIVHEIQVGATQAVKIGTATGTAVAGTGVAVAAFGPTAAMAVATTFGVASTGTAISALSGAAATSAALAWLGGGALAAGGGGMAAGSAFLALAGPVGWAIGGAAVVGTGVFIRRRNRKLAMKAQEIMIKIEAEVRSLQTAHREIVGLAKATKAHADGCLSDLAVLRQSAPSDYSKFDKASKERLAAVINHIRTLGELIQKKVV